MRIRIYSLIVMTFIYCTEEEPAYIPWVKIDEVEKIIENFPEMIFATDIFSKKYMMLQK